MIFKKQPTESSIEGDGVPRPPKNNTNSETAEQTTEHHNLERDNLSSVQETLMRLKKNQVLIGSNKSPKLVKTASSLPSTNELLAQKMTKRIILFVIVGIILVAMALAVRLYSNSSTNNPFAGIDGISADQTDVEISPQDLDLFFNSLQNINTSAAYYVMFTEGESDSNTTTTKTQIIEDTLAQLGLNFDQNLVASIATVPTLMIKTEGQENKFVLGFLVRDYPYTVKGLRSWESESNSINQKLAQATSFSQTSDVSFQSLDYRVINNELAYTIVNQDLVLIGSDPEIIESSRSALRARSFSN